METLKHKVLDISGKEVGDIELDASVFGGPVHEILVHDTVRWQRARKRAGTHSTLTKGTMSGGGRKPWKQKGTGRARSGSNTSPIWVGGGVAHGPHPRDYDYRLPKRTRRQALVSVLSDKVQKNTLMILDSLVVDGGKTSSMVKILKKLGLENKKVVIVVKGDVKAESKKAVAKKSTSKKKEVKKESNDTVTLRTSRNIPKVLPLTVSGINVYDLVNHSYLLGTKEDILALQARVQGDKAEK